jgi:hypothetical protein
MNDSTSPKARVAVFMMVFGAVLGALGLLVLAYSLFSLAEGNLFGHAGAVTLLIVGTPPAFVGLWALRTGRRRYSEAER